MIIHTILYGIDRRVCQMSKLAIVLIGYNRAQAMQSVLSSLQRIDTDRKDLTLVLSIEGEATQDVVDVANSFEWPFGDKIIVRHEQRLGLRNHFIWVGDQTETYENVIFLEDDLYVSPYIIDCAEAFIEKYSSDGRIAGGSFYSPLVCEFNSRRFYQIEDGGDSYFFQHPYWGNLWMKDKWASFREWFKTYERKDEILPIYVRGWKKTSFKVVYIQYLIETGTYIVYPRISVVNNMGIAGHHNSKNNVTYQVPILTKRRDYNLLDFDDSYAIYDAGFEIIPNVLKRLNPKLEAYDFQVDLQKTQDHYTKEYVLTFGKSDKAILRFNGHMKPYETAIAMDISGEEIILIKKEELAESQSNRSLWFYDFLHNNVVTDRRALYFLQDLSKLLAKNTIKRLHIKK
jgi:hypothetical protein